MSITTETITPTDWSEFLNAATDAALWSTQIMADDGEMIGMADELAITDTQLSRLRGAIAYYGRDWIAENGATACEAIDAIDGYGWPAVGHDFWLTTQGHGAGFWDRGLEDLGDALTDSCQGMTDMVGLWAELDENDDWTLMVDTYNIGEGALHDGLTN